MSEKQTETSTGGQDMGPFKAGPPFKFTDVQSLQLAIQAYFDSCDYSITPTHCSEEIPEDVREQIMDSLGQAKRRTEEYAESQLFEGNANGARFNLTNNHGWVEKTVQEHEGGFFGTGGRLEVEIINPEPTPDATPEAEAEPDPEPGAAPTA